jgi:hypothetical protein
MRRLQACFAVVGIALFFTLPVRTQTQNETTRLTGIQLSQEGPMFPFGICLTSQMSRKDKVSPMFRDTLGVDLKGNSTEQS